MMTASRRNLIGTTLAASSLLFAMTVAAAEPPASIAGLVAVCTGCHGSDGVSSNPEVPTIAGIPMYAHADALAAYQDGARTCDDDSKMMCTVAQRLSDEQMEAFGEYYASLPFQPAAQEFDAEKAALGAKIHEENCARCHTDGGSNPDDEAGILAGQWMHYLRESLKAFIAGEREQPRKMKEKTASLSADQCEALVHYYASQQ